MSKYVPIKTRPIETKDIFDKYWSFGDQKVYISERHQYEFLHDQRKCSIEMLEYHMKYMDREVKIRAMWSIEQLKRIK